jgi:hypothetical protein
MFKTFHTLSNNYRFNDCGFSFHLPLIESISYLVLLAGFSGAWQKHESGGTGQRPAVR